MKKGQLTNNFDDDYSFFFGHLISVYLICMKFYYYWWPVITFYLYLNLQTKSSKLENLQQQK